MAASNINLDAAIQARFSGSVMQDLGCVVTLPDSLFVPGLSCNLISIGKLTRNRFSAVKHKDKMVVSIDDDIHFTCSMKDGILEFCSTI
jgi:hypothetical protein